MSNKILIQSDGTPNGTKAFYPDGTRIGGVCSYTFPTIKNNVDALVTMECELTGQSVTGKCVRLKIESDPTGAAEVSVLSPTGVQLSVKRMQARIDTLTIPMATIEFYVGEGPVK